MGNLEKILDNIKNIWNERTFGQKFSLIFLLIAFIAVLTYFLAVSSQPDWEVLYAELSTTDAAAVAEHLKEAGIPYRISNGGQTILVPKNVAEQTAMDVAKEDIITQDAVGLEELSNIPLGLTESQQRLMRQRMLQGELIRTIKVINAVKDVRITIAEPERSVFSSEEDFPTASVMLILKPGMKVSMDQVKSVKNLVAHAIPGLGPDHVFVSDQQGRLLSEEVTGSGSTIDELRSQYERSVEKKVKNVLNKLVGSDNLSVSVTADMNFDRTVSKIERFIPTGETQDGNASGVLISEQIAGEKYTGEAGQAPQGAPGADANVENPQYAATGNGERKSSDYNKDSIVKNYEVSKEVKNITYAPGDVERLTVAVAMNRVLTTKEQATIEQLVKTAAGVEDARGDIVTVTGMAFAAMEQLEEQKAELAKQAQMDQYLTLFEKLAPYILIVLFGGVAIAIFWSLVKAPVQTAEYEEVIEEDYDYPEVPELLEAASIPAIEAKLDPEIERMRSEINAFIMTDPSEAARLLLTYMKD